MRMLGLLLLFVCVGCAREQVEVRVVPLPDDWGSQVEAGRVDALERQLDRLRLELTRLSLRVIHLEMGGQGHNPFCPPPHEEKREPEPDRQWLEKLRKEDQLPSSFDEPANAAPDNDYPGGVS